MPPFVSQYRVPPTKAPALAPARTAPLAGPAAALALATAPLPADAVVRAAAPAEAAPVALGPDFQVLEAMVARPIKEARQAIAWLEKRLPGADPLARKQLEATLTVMRRRLADLERLAAAVRRARANPATTAADVARLRGLVIEGTGQAGTERRGQIVLKAESAARNIGRVPPGDMAVFNKMIAVDQKLGAIRYEYEALQQRLVHTKDPVEAARIDLKLRQLTRHLEQGERLMAALRRHAEDPDLDPRLWKTTSDLADMYQGDVDSEDVTKILAKIGLERPDFRDHTTWPAGRDHGLQERDLNLAAMEGDLRAALDQLADEAQGAKPADLPGLARRTAELEAYLAALVRVRAAVRRLALGPQLTPAARRQVTALVDAVHRARDAAALVRLAQQLERLGSPVAADRVATPGRLADR